MHTLARVSHVWWHWAHARRENVLNCDVQEYFHIDYMMTQEVHLVIFLLDFVSNKQLISLKY